MCYIMYVLREVFEAKGLVPNLVSEDLPGPSGSNVMECRLEV